MALSIKYDLKDFKKSAIMKSYGLNSKATGLQLKPNLKQRIDGQIGNDTNLFLANTCFRRMAKYVPKDTGMLMATVTVRPKSVTYEVPYAKKQFYENKGKGLRGKRWDLAVKNNEGHLIAKEVENFMKNLKNQQIKL